MAKIILNVDLNYEGASADLKKLKADLNGIGNPSGAKNIDSLRKSYANLINTIQGAEKNYAKGTFGNILKEAQDGLLKLSQTAPLSAKELKSLDLILKRLQADFSETRTNATNFHGSLKDIVGGFMKFQLAAMLVMKPLQWINSAFDSLNETLEKTEKRVVAIRRVAGQSVNANELYNLAQQYGQTFDNVADTVENFAKSGYTWEESLKAAEAALIAMNVAELDAQQSSEGLIAVMKQYKMEIKDLDYIINILNKTADTSAVSTEELLIALQKTGSTADNANISLEETIGLISALSEGTAASGQNIGNALRSLIVFTSDSKALDQFAGLSENMEKTVKNYRAGQASILDVWQGLGTELQGMGSQKGTLEDLFGGAEMSADIEAQLTQITDSFAEIYGTAGNYRQNYFIALLNNIKDVQKATDEMKKANGYSQAENLEYLGTYEAKVNALTAKWQEMANDEQGILKFKKDMADLALFGLDAVDKVGGIRTVAIALGGALLSVLVPAMKVANLKLKELGITANATIGNIAGIITVISIVIGKFEEYRQKQREANQERIEEWESNQKYAASLNDLYNKITDLDVASESYAETEKELTSLLGDKANSLDSLTKGTEEYKKALEQLTKTELERMKFQQESARIAAENELRMSTDLWSFVSDNFTNPEASLLGLITGSIQSNRAFKDAGIDYDNPGELRTLEGLLNSTSPEDIVKGYDYLVETKEKLVKSYANVTDESLKNAYRDTIFMISEEISRLEPSVTAYKNASKTIEELTGLIAENTNETANALEKIYKGTSTFSKKELEDVLTKVEEIRNATKNTLEYEEKKKAVLEAEKALLDAQNNRTVRVLNEATGQWEWVSNEKDVESARENLEKARLALEDGFFTDVKTLFESGNQTTEDIFKLIEKWFGAGGGTQATGKLLELLGINQNWGRWWGYEDVKNAGYGDWVLDENAYFAKTGTWEGYRDYLANAYTQIANQWGITPAYKINGEMVGDKGAFRWTTYQDAIRAGFKDIMRESVFNRNGYYYDIYDGSYQKYLDEMYEKYFGKAPAYDSGGVLKGLGGIKATTNDEVVLDPSISQKLLSPVSNKQFDTFVKDLGLLFGVSKSVSSNGIIYTNGGGGVDSHDKHYSVNGIPIPVEAASRYTISELFENMNLIPNI